MIQLHVGAKLMKIGESMRVLHSFAWNYVKYVKYANMEGFHRDSHILVPLDPREKLYVLGFCISWYLIQLPWRNLKLHGFMESKSMESLTKFLRFRISYTVWFMADPSAWTDLIFLTILRIYGETYQIKNLYILAGYSESSHLTQEIYRWRYHQICCKYSTTDYRGEPL